MQLGLSTVATIGKVAVMKEDNLSTKDKRLGSKCVHHYSEGSTVFPSGLSLDLLRR